MQLHATLELRNHDELLNVHNVEVQATRISDILTTFHTVLHDQSKSSLLLLAESLRVCELLLSVSGFLTRAVQSNTKQFPLNYAINMEVEQLSTIYTISFTNPRLNPNKDGDFCVYFTLETDGAETLVSDLALFIHTLRQKLTRWSVLGYADQLDPDNPAHPVLRDLAYCWDGVACAHGVLQFGATPVSVMNIHRVFHRTSRICGPFCQAHRYEYFASGVFLDVERAAILPVFTEMEVAAQYVYSKQFLLIFEWLTILH